MTLPESVTPSSLPIWDCPILVVDDVRWNRELIVAVLLEAGFSRISQAGDGGEALEAIRQAPPDLVILDIMMPGINGYEVCRHLRADHAYIDLPILVQTALTGAEDRNRAFQAGTTDLVCKPLDRTELLARVCIHLENRLMIRDLRLYRARLEGELTMARAVLEHLQPSEPTLANLSHHHQLSVRAHSVRALELGGDLWNVQVLEDGRIVLFLLDMADLGVSAALNACRLHTIVEEMLATSDAPAEILEAINERALDLLGQGMEAALVLGILDCHQSLFRYASAAAMPPLVIDPARIEPTLGQPGGPALGRASGTRYQEHQLPLAPDGVLILYGTSVLDALARIGESAAPQRLGQIVQATLGDRESSLETAFQMIDERLREIAGPRPTDDQTLVWIERHAAALPTAPTTRGGAAT